MTWLVLRPRGPKERAAQGNVRGKLAHQHGLNSERRGRRGAGEIFRGQATQGLGIRPGSVDSLRALGSYGRAVSEGRAGSALGLCGDRPAGAGAGGQGQESQGRRTGLGTDRLMRRERGCCQGSSL